MTIEKYKIISNKQIGYFVLNSSINENRNLENIYGHNLDKGNNNLNLKSFEQFDKLFSDAGVEIEGLEDLKKEYIDNHKNQYEVFYDCGIELLYENEKLFYIIVDGKCKELNFNNHYIFKEKPEDIINLFCAALEEYPLINKQDIYFPKNHISFWAFSEDVTPDGKVKWAKQDTESYSEKSFTMYAGPRDDDQTYDDYMVYKPKN